MTKKEKEKALAEALRKSAAASDTDVWYAADGRDAMMEAADFVFAWHYFEKLLWDRSTTGEPITREFVRQALDDTNSPEHFGGYLTPEFADNLGLVEAEHWLTELGNVLAGAEVTS